MASTSNIDLSTGGLLTVDGVSLSSGDRVLVKDQTLPAENGIYVVAAGTWIRSEDFDEISPVDEVNRAYVAVQEGTASGGVVFVQQGDVSTLGTDAVNFVFFNASGNLVGGDGITVSGTNISVDHDGQGLDFSGAQLSLELDGATLSKSGTGIKVADLGVGSGQLADDSVTAAKLNSDTAGLGLTQAAGGELDVSVDDSTIEIATDTLQVKDGGITDAKVASGSSLEEAVTFFGATDLSGAEAETLSDGSNADSLHEHGQLFVSFTNNTGSSIASGTVLALSLSVSGEVILADASSISTAATVAGVAAATIANGASGKVQIAGITTPTQDAAYSLGQEVWLSETAGSTTSTAPSTVGTVSFKVGDATSTTQIVLRPQFIGIN